MSVCAVETETYMESIYLPSNSMLPMTSLKSLSVWRPLEEKKLSELNWMLFAAESISLFKTSFTCTCKERSILHLALPLVNAHTRTYAYIHM